MKAETFHNAIATVVQGYAEALQQQAVELAHAKESINDLIKQLVTEKQKVTKLEAELAVTKTEGDVNR